MSLYEVIGEKKPVNLLADPQGSDIIAVPMKPGNGVVKMGTLIYRGEDGQYLPAAAAAVVETNYLAVLNEDVDTDADETVAENAAAFRAGKLIDGAVILADNGEITAAMKVILRKQGIVFGQMVKAE